MSSVHVVMQSFVKRELLAALAFEQNRGAAKQTADAIVALGGVLLEGKGTAKGWTELLGSLQGWLSPESGSSAVAREAALLVSQSPSPGFFVGFRIRTLVAAGMRF